MDFETDFLYSILFETLSLLDNLLCDSKFVIDKFDSFEFFTIVIILRLNYIGSLDVNLNNFEFLFKGEKLNFCD
jgi:hypothetical protein